MLLDRGLEIASMCLPCVKFFAETDIAKWNDVVLLRGPRPLEGLSAV